MGLLDWEPIRLYKPPRFKKKNLDENLEELNNLGHEEVTEDFSDSPHADREEKI